MRNIHIVNATRVATSDAHQSRRQADYAREPGCVPRYDAGA